MKFVKAIFLIVFFFFALLFVIQNRDAFITSLDLKLHLFGWNWSSSMPIYMNILLAFLIGAILVLMFFFFDTIKKNKEIKMYRMRVEELEQELDSIHNIEFEEEQQYQEETQE